MHISECIAQMQQLQYTHPARWEQFKAREFAVSTNLIAFTAISIDQALEHINKIHKGYGGVNGMTTNPESILRCCFWVSCYPSNPTISFAEFVNLLSCLINTDGSECNGIDAECELLSFELLITQMAGCEYCSWFICAIYSEMCIA